MSGALNREAARKFVVIVVGEYELAVLLVSQMASTAVRARRHHSSMTRRIPNRAALDSTRKIGGSGHRRCVSCEKAESQTSLSQGGPVRCSSSSRRVWNVLYIIRSQSPVPLSSLLRLRNLLAAAHCAGRAMYTSTSHVFEVTRCLSGWEGPVWTSCVAPDSSEPQRTRSIPPLTCIRIGSSLVGARDRHPPSPHSNTYESTPDILGPGC